MMFKILKFSAVWCQPCKIMRPIVQRLCEEFKIQSEEFDVENPNNALLIRKLEIRSVPTLVMLTDDGYDPKQYRGRPNYVNVKEWLIEVLK